MQFLSLQMGNQGNFTTLRIQRQICEISGKLLNREFSALRKIREQNKLKTILFACELWSSLIKQRLPTWVRKWIYRKNMNLRISLILMFSIFSMFIEDFIYYLKLVNTYRDLDYHVDRFSEFSRHMVYLLTNKVFERLLNEALNWKIKFSFLLFMVFSTLVMNGIT